MSLVRYGSVRVRPFWFGSVRFGRTKKKYGSVVHYEDLKERRTHIVKSIFSIFDRESVSKSRGPK